MGEKCNATAEERARMFALFSSGLSREEQEQAELVLTQYLFYHRLSHNRRLFYCTACGNVWEARKGGPRWNGLSHNRNTGCPICRANVISKAAGRLGTGENGYPSLDEYHTLVLLRRGEDGALLISAGLLEARYWPPECMVANLWLGAEDDRDFPDRQLCFYERRRYYMAPGKLAAWRRICGSQSRYYRMFGSPVSGWCHLNTAGEPVPKGSICAPQLDDGAYYVLGWDCLPDTAMRYSAVEQLFPPDCEKSRLYRGPVGYLAHYTRKPQLELLTKLGLYHVILELLENGSLHGLVNWRAKSPQKFFRLTKRSYRAWVEAGGYVSQLRLYQALSGNITMERLMSFPVTREAPDRLPRIANLAGRYRLPMERLLEWLADGQRAQLWLDYVTMGEKLQLDFSRRDVLLPKELAARHDAAAATLELEENAEGLKQYQRIKRELYQLYAMEAAGYFIRIPETAAEIVAEGRALCHCVGGYAPRHIEGKVAILFLRAVEDPDTPLCTIEMNRDRLIQIHGYKNDRESGCVPPSERFADFLNVWLPWVKAHSPRDAQGRPVLPEKERCTA